jgi:hypothetical protein
MQVNFTDFQPPSLFARRILVVFKVKSFKNRRKCKLRVCYYDHVGFSSLRPEMASGFPRGCLRLKVPIFRLAVKSIGSVSCFHHAFLDNEFYRLERRTYFSK